MEDKILTAKQLLLEKKYLNLKNKLSEMEEKEIGLLMYEKEILKNINYTIIDFLFKYLTEKNINILLLQLIRYNKVKIYFYLLDKSIKNNKEIIEHFLINKFPDETYKKYSDINCYKFFNFLISKKIKRKKLLKYFLKYFYETKFLCPSKKKKYRKRILKKYYDFIFHKNSKYNIYFFRYLLNTNLEEKIDDFIRNYLKNEEEIKLIFKYRIEIIKKNEYIRNLIKKDFYKYIDEIGKYQIEEVLDLINIEKIKKSKNKREAVLFLSYYHKNLKLLKIYINKIDKDIFIPKLLPLYKSAFEEFYGYPKLYDYKIIKFFNYFFEYMNEKEFNRILVNNKQFLHYFFSIKNINSIFYLKFFLNLKYKLNFNFKDNEDYTPFDKLIKLIKQNMINKRRYSSLYKNIILLIIKYDINFENNFDFFDIFEDISSNEKEKLIALLTKELKETIFNKDYKKIKKISSLLKIF